MALKLLLIDIDGVLTSGKKMYDVNHEHVYKEFNDKDFTAIKRFKADGIKVIAITGDSFNAQMCQKRNIGYLNAKDFDKNLDKSKAIGYICEQHQVSPKEVAYIGDDWWDISLLKIIGYPFCPADALEDLDCVTGIRRLKTKGGDGVLAELYRKCKIWFRLKGNLPDDNS